jgi:hypothetical protein
MKMAALMIFWPKRSNHGKTIEAQFQHKTGNGKLRDFAMFVASENKKIKDQK